MKCSLGLSNFLEEISSLSVVNAAEVDFFFFSFLSFLYDPINVGNLTNGSSACSKSSLYIWNFLVHILLMPNFKDLDHYLNDM